VICVDFILLFILPAEIVILRLMHVPFAYCVFHLVCGFKYLYWWKFSLRAELFSSGGLLGLGHTSYRTLSHQMLPNTFFRPLDQGKSMLFLLQVHVLEFIRHVSLLAPVLSSIYVLHLFVDLLYVY
jgi:hypothetical protein